MQGANAFVQWGTFHFAVEVSCPIQSSEQDLCQQVFVFHAGRWQALDWPRTFCQQA